MKCASPLRAATLALAVSVAALAGCATGAPGALSPQASVFAVKSGYAVALRVAVTYRELPACKAPPVQPCSEPTMVARVQKANAVALAALDAAEDATRAGGSANVRDAAITAAQAAVAAFVAITNQLGVK